MFYFTEVKIKIVSNIEIFYLYTLTKCHHLIVTITGNATSVTVC